MGLVKSEWMEAQEQGWGAIEKVVCSRCVKDDALRRVIRANATSKACDYCRRTNQTAIAAPVEVLQEAIYAAIWTYYHEPTDAGVPWDGGFVIDPIDTDDVLHQLGFDGHPDLVEDIIDADMGNGWVAAAEGHWATGHDHEVMLQSWSSFVDVIKHETRYHFGRVGTASAAGPLEVEPRQMLDALGEHLRPYVRRLAVGTLVYRVRERTRKEKWEPNAKELGAPPPQKARSGRMNPAGIPYLYAAFNEETALHEAGAARRTTNAIFVATFELTQPLLVIDLTSVTKLPSVFDLNRKPEREKLLFARGFAQEISQPVNKNGQEEHIEYVPSQIVCEYLAQVFVPKRGAMLSGLVFPSSVHPDGKNLVVFPSGRGWHPSFHGVEFNSAVQHRRSKP